MNTKFKPCTSQSVKSIPVARLLPLVLVTLAFVFLSASPVRAAVLFSNLLQPDSGAVSFEDTVDRNASDFLTDGTPRTITSLTARMGNTGFITHTVTFSIYTDNAGVPGVLVSVFDTPASLPAGTSGLFTATTSTGIDLQANTPYWVVGQVDEAPVLGTVTWQFNLGEGTDAGSFSTLPGTEFLQSPNSGANYFPVDSGNLMFSLDGGSTVPEPSTVMLVMIGLAAAGLFRWMRIRREPAS